MLHRRKLFIATTIIEGATGLSLVGAPALVMWLLLGAREPSTDALMVSRIAGAALLAIGVACWLARGDQGSVSQHGLLSGMLIYNVGACAVLAYAGSTLPKAGGGPWAGVVLHSFMAIWCVGNVRGAPPIDG